MSESLAKQRIMTTARAAARAAAEARAKLLAREREAKEAKVELERAMTRLENARNSSDQEMECLQELLKIAGVNYSGKTYQYALSELQVYGHIGANKDLTAEQRDFNMGRDAVIREITNKEEKS